MESFKYWSTLKKFESKFDCVESQGRDREVHTDKFSDISNKRFLRVSSKKQVVRLTSPLPVGLGLRMVAE